MGYKPFFLSLFFSLLVLIGGGSLLYTYGVMDGAHAPQAVFLSTGQEKPDEVRIQWGEQSCTLPVTWRETLRDAVNTLETAVPNSLRLAGQAAAWLRRTLFACFDRL